MDGSITTAVKEYLRGRGYEITYLDREAIQAGKKAGNYGIAVSVVKNPFSRDEWRIHYVVATRSGLLTKKVKEVTVYTPSENVLDTVKKVINQFGVG